MTPLKLSPDERCAKCNYPLLRMQHNPVRYSGMMEIGEHLEITCHRCGYMWVRSPLDMEMESPHG